MSRRVFSALLIILVAFGVLSDELSAQGRTKIVVGYALMSSVATTLWIAPSSGVSKGG